MKKIPTFILRLTIILASLAVLAIFGGAMYVLFTTNHHSRYFILAIVLFLGVVFVAIPCWIALYNAYKLILLIDSNQAFSMKSLENLKKIQYCAIAVCIVTTLAGLPFFYILADLEDAPGLVIIGLAFSGVSFVIAVFASVLGRLLQEAIELKLDSELVI